MRKISYVGPRDPRWALYVVDSSRTLRVEILWGESRRLIRFGFGTVTGERPMLQENEGTISTQDQPTGQRHFVSVEMSRSKRVVGIHTRPADKIALHTMAATTWKASPRRVKSIAFGFLERAAFAVSALASLIAQAIGQSRHHLILQLDQVDGALYCARNPPSTASVCPVIMVAAGPARKAIAAAISAGSASFLKGVIASMRAISSGSLRMGPISSVRT